MSYGLTSLNPSRGFYRDYTGENYGIIKGDARSLEPRLYICIVTGKGAHPPAKLTTRYIGILSGMHGLGCIILEHVGCRFRVDYTGICRFRDEGMYFAKLKWNPNCVDRAL